MVVATIQQQKFQVKGLISFPIIMKLVFNGNDIVRLEANLHVGTKKHVLIADTDITLVNSILSMPIETSTRSNCPLSALAYANKIVNSNDLHKVVVTIELNGKKKKFTVTSNIIVNWTQAI